MTWRERAHVFTSGEGGPPVVQVLARQCARLGQRLRKAIATSTELWRARRRRASTLSAYVRRGGQLAKDVGGRRVSGGGLGVMRAHERRNLAVRQHAEAHSKAGQGVGQKAKEGGSVAGTGGAVVIGMGDGLTRDLPSCRVCMLLSRRRAGLLQILATMTMRERSRQHVLSRLVQQFSSTWPAHMPSRRDRTLLARSRYDGSVHLVAKCGEEYCTASIYTLR